MVGWLVDVPGEDGSGLEDQRWRCGAIKRTEDRVFKQAVFAVTAWLPDIIFGSRVAALWPLWQIPLLLSFSTVEHFCLFSFPHDSVPWLVYKNRRGPSSRNGGGRAGGQAAD